MKAIINGKVFTVTGQTYDKATVLIENGKIKAIRRSSLGAEGDVIAVLTNDKDDIVKFLFIYSWTI